MSVCAASILALRGRMRHGMAVRCRHGSIRAYPACLVLLACAFSPRIAYAQIATDGSLGAQTSLTGPNYSIDDALGQQRGANLFHSFSTFSIAANESAVFDSTPGTANIIARVTGGFGTEINGALSANANLYLLNPQGIMVGANAAINVTGSLHLSTADYVRLGSSSRFYANLGSSSVLISAAPSAFGFLDGAIAPIRLSGADLSLSSGRTLSVVGGDLVLEQSQLTVPGGRLNLASSASAGEVVLGSGTLDTSSIASHGEIRLDGVTVNTPLTESANVFIRAGQFVMENGSSLAGDATATSGLRIVDVAADSVQLRGSNIDYRAQSGAAGTQATIRADDFSASESSVISLSGGGDLAIQANNILVSTSSIGTRTGAGGRVGSLTIREASNGGALTIDGGLLTTESDAGDAGGITIAVDSINIERGGRVVSRTTGTGAGGTIAISGDRLVIDGSQSVADTGITAGSASAAAGAGNAGSIDIDVQSVEMNAGFISSTTNGAGRGGDISVRAGTSLLMEQNASITSETGIVGGQGPPATFGSGGSIFIDATDVQLASGARISASTFAAGAGGDIEVVADRMRIDSAGVTPLTTGITANSGAAGIAAAGNGGNLSLQVQDLQIHAFGQVATNTQGSGQAGVIIVRGNSLLIDSGGVISASSLGQGADAGAANDIEIDVETLIIDDHGQIRNGTTGRGDAGRLSIAAGSLMRISNSGLVQSSSLSAEDTAGSVGDIDIETGTLILSSGSIQAESQGGAAPGTIEIGANTITMNTGAVVSTRSAGAGDAGAIQIRVADTLRLTNGSLITTEAARGSGGRVEIIGGNRLLLSNSSISTSVQGLAVDGGNINISPAYAILGNSQIVARAVGGSGGAITLATQVLIRDAQSAVDASSALGISGRVDIAGLDIDLNADFAALPIEFLSARDWQATPCAESSETNSSRFTVAGRDGAYRSPLDYLQGPLILDPTRTELSGEVSAAGRVAANVTLPSFASLCVASR